MSKDSDEVTFSAGAALGLLLAIGMPLATIYSGWTITLLWKWFVADPFHVQEIGIAHAIGLNWLCAFLILTSSKPSEDKSFAEIITTAVLFSFMKTTMCLVAGLIFSYWV